MVASMASARRHKQPFRKTHDSVVPGDFAPPYQVNRDFHKYDDGLVHACGWCYGAEAYVTCCRLRFGPTLVCYEGPTCLKCLLCKGCPACKDGYITEDTMRLGKWETKDGRKLYPFEMDDTHLVNAINKLIRDEDHFKDNWVEWAGILEIECKKRGLL